MYGFTQFCMLLCNWPVHMGFMLKSLGLELSQWFFPVHSAKWEDRCWVKATVAFFQIQSISPFTNNLSSVLYGLVFTTKCLFIS